MQLKGDKIFALLQKAEGMLIFHFPRDFKGAQVN